MKHKTYKTEEKKAVKSFVMIGKVSVGHQGNTHQAHDGRPKRLRTRQAQKNCWSREY